MNVIITKPRFALLLAVLLAVPAFAVLSPKSVSADEGEPHTAQAEDRDEEQNEEQKETESQQKAESLGKYTYVAQPGDSYTLMARKAVQTYGKKFDAKLSLAGIIFAETNLTLVAGSPQLAVGQQVEIDEATVRDWVDRALNLSDAEEAAWDYYVQFVGSFSTDAVGQPAN